MLFSFYDNMDTVPTIIISVSFMIFFGFAMTRITKKLRLPNVTAYIITGIIMGPFCLDLVPKNIVDGMDFISDIALAFIAFGTGEFFKVKALKKNGPKVILVTIFEAIISAVVIFVLMYFVFKLSLAFSIILAAIASATAPTSTLMTIRQTKAKGTFVDTILQVVALDDIIALFTFSIALSVIQTSGETLSFITIIKPLLINIGVIIIGALFGVLLKLLMPQSRSTDNRLIISVGTLLTFCGICALLDISPLLGCMSMGMIYTNISQDDKLFKQLAYFSPPFLLLFFVRSGLNFDLSALFSKNMLGAVPLIVIGVSYFLVRIVGKYLGAYLGTLIVKSPKEVRNYLGLALIPQASVAIGLASLGARALDAEMGSALITIILAASIINELVGPACAKLSLYLSKSYSNEIEDIVQINEIKDDGNEKTEVEKLIERINKIKENIPKVEISEEEEAFNEAAEEQNFDTFNVQKRGMRKWRGR